MDHLDQYSLITINSKTSEEIADITLKKKTLSINKLLVLQKMAIVTKEKCFLVNNFYVHSYHHHQFRLLLRLILLLFATSFICHADGQRLVITPQASEHITRLDDEVTLTCSLFDYNDKIRRGGGGDKKQLSPKIIWYGQNGQEISQTRGRIYVERFDAFNLRLHLTKIEDDDEGRYECKATTDDGLSSAAATIHLSDETNIVLYQDITFVETPTLERHLLGTSALLQCKVYGTPKPEISWYFNGRKVLPDGGKCKFEVNGLRVNQLDLRDNGLYECRAEQLFNGHVKSKIVTLDLLYPPVILRQPTADAVVRGEDVKLQCRADGNPSVTYEWYREQKMSDAIRVRVRLSEVSEIYTIEDVDVEDEGRYFCRVTNSYGFKEVPVDVKIMVPPVIKALPAKVSLFEEKTLNIICEASGIPVPVIAWNITSSSSSQLRIPTGNWMENLQPGMNSLTIRDLHRSYAGLLRCSAQSLAGLDVKTVALNVEYAALISFKESEQFGWSGEIRNFTCQAKGFPLPSVTWLRLTHVLKNSETYQITNSVDEIVNSTLTIKVHNRAADDEIFGIYTCVAKNAHGSASESVKFIKAVVPDMLRNVSVLEETATTVTLEATPPPPTPSSPSSSNKGHQFLPFLSWMVKYEPAKDDSVEQKTKIFNFNDTLFVTDLIPGTTYTFYLSISNAVGYSNPLKFRVTTSRKVNHKEQSDVPGGGNVEEARRKTEKKFSSNDDSDNNKNYNDNDNDYDDESKNDVIVGKSLMSNRDMIIILFATAVGSLIVILSIIMAAVCVAWRKKKMMTHRYASPDQQQRATAEGDHRNRMMLLPIWEPDEGGGGGGGGGSQHLPDIVRSDDRRSDDDASACQDGERKRREGEGSIMTAGIYPGSSSMSPPVVRPTTPGGRKQLAVRPSAPPTEQRPELTAATAAGAKMGDDGDDLPPPPAFLLYPEASRGQVQPHRSGDDALIVDGYHSGDNVDDDIDQIDYTIRIPSFHSQIFKYS